MQGGRLWLCGLLSALLDVLTCETFVLSQHRRATSIIAGAECLVDASRRGVEPCRTERRMPGSLHKIEGISEAAQAATRMGKSVFVLFPLLQ